MSGGAEPGIRVPLCPRVLSKTPCGLGLVGTSSDLVKKSFDQLTPVSWPISKMTVRSPNNWEPTSPVTIIKKKPWGAVLSRRVPEAPGDILFIPTPQTLCSSRSQAPATQAPFLFMFSLAADLPRFLFTKHFLIRSSHPLPSLPRINQDSAYCLTNVLVLKQKHP